MTKHTAARICQRINDKEVAVPGVWRAASVQQANGDWAARLYAADAQVVHRVATVEQWQQLTNGPEEQG